MNPEPKDHFQSGYNQTPTSPPGTDGKAPENGLAHGLDPALDHPELRDDFEVILGSQNHDDTCSVDENHPPTDSSLIPSAGESPLVKRLRTQLAETTIRAQKAEKALEVKREEKAVADDALMMERAAHSATRQLLVEAVEANETIKLVLVQAQSDLHETEAVLQLEEQRATSLDNTLTHERTLEGRRELEETIQRQQAANDSLREQIAILRAAENRFNKHIHQYDHDSRLDQEQIADLQQELSAVQEQCDDQVAQALAVCQRREDQLQALKTMFPHLARFIDIDNE